MTRPGPTYYHGTAVEGVTHILPAAQHVGEVTFPDWTNHEYAYATTNHDSAWKYAQHSLERMGTGRPRVYEVVPLGGHEHVEEDPPWDHERNRSRNLYGGERRSKKGWRVVREISTPEHLTDSKGWGR